MSIAAFAWATKQKAGGVAAKAVLRALADYADDTGLCWPSQATLAFDTELTDRSVRDQLVKLEKSGLITREEYRRRDGTQGSDRIRLNMEDCRKDVPPERKDVPISRKDVPAVQAEPLSEQPEGRSALTTFEPPLEPPLAAAANAPEARSDWPMSNPVNTLVAQVLSPRLDPSKSPGLITTAGRLQAWRRDGASWEFDVVPVVTGMSQRPGGLIGTWKFFDAAIAQSMADNRQALLIPSARPARRGPAVQGWNALEQAIEGHDFGDPH